jgi:hypothetical protein
VTRTWKRLIGMLDLHGEVAAHFDASVQTSGHGTGARWKCYCGQEHQNDGSNAEISRLSVHAMLHILITEQKFFSDVLESVDFVSIRKYRGSQTGRVDKDCPTTTAQRRASEHDDPAARQHGHDVSSALT